MSQFFAYKNPHETTNKIYPYLLDIQSCLLDNLTTTLVIPLCPSCVADNAAISKLCPALEMAQQTYIALTQQIAVIDKSALTEKVSDLSHYREEVIAAINLIIFGI